MSIYHFFSLCKIDAIFPQLTNVLELRLVRFVENICNIKFKQSILFQKKIFFQFHNSAFCSTSFSNFITKIEASFFIIFNLFILFYHFNLFIIFYHFYPFLSFSSFFILFPHLGPFFHLHCRPKALGLEQGSKTQNHSRATFWQTKWAHGPHNDKNRSPRASIEGKRSLNST